MEHGLTEEARRLAVAAEGGRRRGRSGAELWRGRRGKTDAASPGGRADATAVGAEAEVAQARIRAPIGAPKKIRDVEPVCPAENWPVGRVSLQADHGCGSNNSARTGSRRTLLEGKYNQYQLLEPRPRLTPSSSAETSTNAFEDSIPMPVLMTVRGSTSPRQYICDLLRPCADVDRESLAPPRQREALLVSGPAQSLVTTLIRTQAAILLATTAASSFSPHRQ